MSISNVVGWTGAALCGISFAVGSDTGALLLVCIGATLAFLSKAGVRA